MTQSKASDARGAYHHGDLRQQLILAVQELVEHHGPQGFSIAEAARRAGVSSGAPYKHFKDRPELLRAVAADGMERLRDAMLEAMAQRAAGSIDAVASAGVAYVEFAKAQPGVFRLMFGLTEGHEKTAELVELGRLTFGVVISAVSAYLKREPSDVEVQERAYMLWAFVHGHAFLTIDAKRKKLPARPDDWTYILAACHGLLSSPSPIGSSGSEDSSR